MALHEHIYTRTEEEEEGGGGGVLWLVEVIGHSGPIGSGERLSISHGRWDKDVAHEDVVGRLDMTTVSPQQWRSVPALTEIRANLHMCQRMNLSKMVTIHYVYELNVICVYSPHFKSIVMVQIHCVCQ